MRTEALGRLRQTGDGRVGDEVGRLLVRDRDRYGARSGEVLGCVTRGGREGVRAVCHWSRVPAEAVRSRGVLGTEVLPVELELDAGDGRVVGCVGRDRDGPGEGAVRGRGGELHDGSGRVARCRVAALMLVGGERFPAWSNASTAMVYVVPQVSPERVADVVGAVPAWAPFLYRP